MGVNESEGHARPICPQGGPGMTLFLGRGKEEAHSWASRCVGGQILVLDRTATFPYDLRFHSHPNSIARWRPYPATDREDVCFGRTFCDFELAL